MAYKYFFLVLSTFKQSYLINYTVGSSNDWFYRNKKLNSFIVEDHKITYVIL